MKRILWAIFILLFVVIAAFVSIGPSYFAAYVDQVAITELKKHDVQLAIEKSNLSFPRYKASGVKLSHLTRKFPFQFQFDELALNPNLSGLASGEIKMQLQGKAYQGTIDGNMVSALKNKAGSGTIHIDNLQLSSHPQLASFGITGGALQVHLDNAAWNAQGPLKGSLFATITNFEKPRETFLMFGLAPIPAITKAQLTLRAEMLPGKLELNSLEHSSNLGNISSKGSFAMGASNRISALDLTVSANLTAEGEKILGPLVSLASRGKLPPDTRSFKLQISGDVAKSNLKVTVL